jgi:hypothetical protein
MIPNVMKHRPPRDESLVALPDTARDAMARVRTDGPIARASSQKERPW